jgi:hypothetical protein
VALVGLAELALPGEFDLPPAPALAGLVLLARLYVDSDEPLGPGRAAMRLQEMLLAASADPSRLRDRALVSWWLESYHGTYPTGDHQQPGALGARTLGSLEAVLGEHRGRERLLREDVRIVVELRRRSSGVDGQTVTGSASCRWSGFVGAVRMA